MPSFKFVYFFLLVLLPSFGDIRDSDPNGKSFVSASADVAAREIERITLSLVDIAIASNPAKTGMVMDSIFKSLLSMTS
jgi:hypothetical protein